MTAWRLMGKKRLRSNLSSFAVPGDDSSSLRSKELACKLPGVRQKTRLACQQLPRPPLPASPPLPLALCQGAVKLRALQALLRRAPRAAAWQRRRRRHHFCRFCTTAQIARSNSRSMKAGRPCAAVDGASSSKAGSRRAAASPRTDCSSARRAFAASASGGASRALPAPSAPVPSAREAASASSAPSTLPVLEAQLLAHVTMAHADARTLLASGPLCRLKFAGGQSLLVDLVVTSAPDQRRTKRKRR